MAVCHFLVADDFDAFMSIIDTDMLENNTEMLSEVNSVVENLYLSKSGLSRHVKSKKSRKFSTQ